MKEDTPLSLPLLFFFWWGAEGRDFEYNMQLCRVFSECLSSENGQDFSIYAVRQLLPSGDKFTKIHLFILISVGD